MCNYDRMLLNFLFDLSHLALCGVGDLGLGLGRFSFFLSKSFVILNVSMSNLMLLRFSRSKPRGSLPSSDTCFICKITSEFSRKLPSIAFMRPNAMIFYFRRRLRSILAS